YVVKDDAIPPEGRQVRCAACKHSWHQNPEAQTEESRSEPVAEPEPSEARNETTPAEAPNESASDDEDLAEATLIDPRSGPEAEERAYEEAVMEGETIAPDADQPLGVEIPVAAAEASQPETTSASPEEDWKEPPVAEAAPDIFSPFAEPDEEEPRRRRPVTTILIIVLVVVIVAALFWLFAPANLKARLGLAAGGASPLALVITHRDRQPLESGNELLTVTGRVINPSATQQDVPPIQAQLKNRSGKIVYSWTIPPPAQSLAPGASATFNSAELKVPPGADELTITLGPPRT
ncbi:MAG: MJ0042-type zinc finger domain-containing protein, partial [Sphingomicrobium sp.]